MTLNDAHLFVRPDQVKSEIAGLIEGWLNRLFEHLLEEIPPPAV